MQRTIENVVETLRNARSRDRKCSVLIGAGCSATAGIPTAQGFVDIIKKDYSLAYGRAKEKTYPKCMACLSFDERRDLIAKYVDTAKKSGINSVIEALPKKYETMLGKWFEDGVELSGGEWQKVALARGFFRQGNFLILDEPTASLDAEAEVEVFRTMTTNRANQITLLISHRFSTVRRADHILFLEDGKCIEQGSHKELMDANGHYAYLFRLQARGYENS